MNNELRERFEEGRQIPDGIFFVEGSYVWEITGDTEENRYRKWQCDALQYRFEGYCDGHQSRQPEIDALKAELSHYKEQLDLTCEEGLTPADAKKLQKWNGELADENQALKAENERLRNTIFEARDQIANSPIDCLGDGYTQEGEAYPIRDEMIHRFTQALQEPTK